MLYQSDIDYFLKREVEERERAASAGDQAVQSAHFELAERYADAAWSAEEALDSPVRASGLWPRHDAQSNAIDQDRTHVR